MGVGVQAQGRQLQLAVERPLVERFDIDQLVPEVVRPGVDLAAGQGIEHEGVVGVRAVADADLAGGYLSWLLQLFPRFPERCRVVSSKP